MMKFKDLFSELKRNGTIQDKQELEDIVFPSDYEDNQYSNSPQYILQEVTIDYNKPILVDVSEASIKPQQENPLVEDSLDSDLVPPQDINIVNKFSRDDPDYIPETDESEDEKESKDSTEELHVEPPTKKCKHEKRQKRKCRTASQKYERNLTKYKLLSPCKNTCKSKCLTKIPSKRREAIHNQYWNLDYNTRRMWIHNHVKKYDIKRTRSNRLGLVERKCSRAYFLPNEEGQDTKICKSFFLKTLGYTCDKVITVTLEGTVSDMISPNKDRRGKHVPSHKLTEENEDFIKAHINSFNPAISHYRREHAPMRKYLPSELTIKQMYDDFKDKHGEKVCCETYRKILKSMNISFSKLGEEECELCMFYENHEHTFRSNEENTEQGECLLCNKWKEHIKRAKECREAYRDDATEDHNRDNVFLSVDLQKVMMLPRLPGVKTCSFTRRIIVFNETFAPLGQKGYPPIGVVWHEAVAGRHAEDITSCFSKVISHEQYRDKKNFIFWTDNCSAQNKNWVLFTGLVSEVNREGGPESIMIKYLEKGHTFMSADSYHAKVEKELRARKNIYDFSDFKSVIDKTGKCLEMKHDDFMRFENGMSTAKSTNKPTLIDVQSVKFSKGSTKIFWKNSTKEDFKSGEFLKKKVCDKISKGLPKGCIFPWQTEPRGITEAKKTNIIKNLGKLMPANRIVFWKNLPVNDKSKDLVDNL